LLGEANVDSSGAGSIHSSEAKPEAHGAAKIRRLIADQQYFGLGAKAFHDGAGRTLARVSAATAESRLDVHSLGEDFHLDADASWRLLRALLAGGLLLSDGPGSYRPTARFREYALAELVMPLTRARARGLLDGARKIAARVNANWTRNPYQIRLILVSGSYMSRTERLPEVSLWLILRRRNEVRTRRDDRMSKSDAMRQIAAALRELSSFLIVRVAPDRQAVPRPFSVVFEADDAFPDSTHSWERFREWGASISRRLSLK
jgi:hypothetical protein